MVTGGAIGVGSGAGGGVTIGVRSIGWRRIDCRVAVGVGVDSWVSSGWNMTWRTLRSGVELGPTAGMFVGTLGTDVVSFVNVLL